MSIRMGEAYIDRNGTLTRSGWDAFIDLERRLAAAEAKIAAAAAVANATGGATIDSQARTQLASIKAALS